MSFESMSSASDRSGLILLINQTFIEPFGDHGRALRQNARGSRGSIVGLDHLSQVLGRGSTRARSGCSFSSCSVLTSTYSLAGMVQIDARVRRRRTWRCNSSARLQRCSGHRAQRRQVDDDLSAAPTRHSDPADLGDRTGEQPMSQSWARKMPGIEILGHVPRCIRKIGTCRISGHNQAPGERLPELGGHACRQGFSDPARRVRCRHRPLIASNRPQGVCQLWLKRMFRSLQERPPTVDVSPASLRSRRLSERQPNAKPGRQRRSSALRT